MAKVTVGGDRLGSGNKNKVHLRNYERSNHDLSYAWRSTMAAGTLVPFLTEVALPGDTHEIDLNVDVLTHPTIGPLFGSYKVQLDIFSVPIRLYNAKLNMNLTEIGLKMHEIKLPLIELKADELTTAELKEKIEKAEYENYQINPSSLLSYLNIRGLGSAIVETIPNDRRQITRTFNAVPYLAYWDIYKQYYSNKQEEIGAMIHKPVSAQSIITPDEIEITGVGQDTYLQQKPNRSGWTDDFVASATIPEMRIDLLGSNNIAEIDAWWDKFLIYITPLPYHNVQTYGSENNLWAVKAKDFFRNVIIDYANARIEASGCDWEKDVMHNPEDWEGSIAMWSTIDEEKASNADIEIHTFPLKNIDNERLDMLKQTEETHIITRNSRAPYGYPVDNNFHLKENGKDMTRYSIQSSQEGLALKTYQSDLFNNWMATEWIDGRNGVNELSRINIQADEITEEQYITVDQILISTKVYEMLTRIAISGGTYDDWLNATYTHERVKQITEPMYCGGLSTELVFEEVISNAETKDQPLGTLAGRGKINGKYKGGKTIIKTHEPSYILGIVSLTPRLDYSQGNKWDTDLKTLDDFHKPAMDEIGFQDLITDQMAWFDTTVESSYKTLYSAGKTPAWINYMTNVNQTRGNFADPDNQMWMTLNRKYEVDPETGRIADLTTYVDPTKFNHIFSYTKIDAQNFWTQIGVGIKARRKMSSKVMPNL